MPTGSIADSPDSVVLIPLRKNTVECLAADLGLSSTDDVIMVMVSTRQGELLHSLAEGTKVSARIKHEAEFKSPLEETKKLVEEVENEDDQFLKSLEKISSFYVGAVYLSCGGVLAAKHCKYRRVPGLTEPVHVSLTCQFG